MTKEKVRFFIDTEFIEQERLAPLELLSIGIVCENGRELYLENIEARLDLANDWVKENVLPYLNSGKIKLNDNEFRKYVQVCMNLPFDTNNLLMRELEELESYNFRCKHNLFTVPEIATQILLFISENCGFEQNLERDINDERLFIESKKPEFWGYFCDYDWVIFCQLFGTMIDLPKGFPFYCNDLKQLLKWYSVDKSLDEITETKSNHNALLDAKQIKQGFDWIMERINSGNINY